MKRTPTPFTPDPNLDSVLANDIGNNVVESRHLAPSEIMEVIEYDIAADASAGVDIFTVPAGVSYRVAEVVVQPTAANGGATVTVRNGTDAITDAIAAAVDNTIGRAGTIDDDYATLAAAGVLNVITNGAADRAKVTITLIKQ